MKVSAEFVFAHKNRRVGDHVGCEAASQAGV